MKTTYLFFLLVLFSFAASAQPGSVNMTPRVDFQDGPLEQKTLLVPKKFQSLIDTTYRVNLPKSYQASVFYIGGLTKPRVLELSPKGVLHVIDFKNNGSIYALPDANKDDVADSLVAVVTGVNAHCFKFYKQDIYVAEQTRILKCSDLDSNGFFETKVVFIDSIGLRANHIGGGHTTRTILFDEERNKLYVSIGSSANVVRDEGRALIEQYNIDGTGRRIFATGIRNAVGMAIEPNTGHLWANNNGSDQQGNDIPPEWISVIEDSGFYGYPFAYGNQVWFNMDAHNDYKALKPITAVDSLWVSKMDEPGGLIQAHSAPMELEYSFYGYADVHWGFFTALHGSWNRSPATGYKLIFLTLNGNGPFKKLEKYVDFMTGFLTDSITRSFWARPVGIAIQPYHLRNPDIYLSSDAGKTCVLKLTCVGGLSGGAAGCNHLGINESKRPEYNIYPNPFKDKIYLEKPLPMHAKVTLLNLEGKEIILAHEEQTHELMVPQIPEGLYILRIQTESTIYQQKLIHLHED